MSGLAVGATYPHVRVKRRSPNQSSRQLARPTLIIVHATAGHNLHGLADLENLASWFANPGSAVSSHVGVDNEGNSARFVEDSQKAWHCAAFNRVSLGIEQVMPGNGTEITEDMYRETARWIALWSKRHSIPIRKGARDGYSVTRSGVLRHSELGAPGGNHDDPGPHYDLGHVLDHARAYRRKM